MAKEILDINKLLKESKDVQKFSAAQSDLITQLIDENKLLREKLTQMETAVKHTSDLSITDQPSPESIVCMEQIQRIREKSNTRELTLEEVKRLDLLIKNLRLTQEQSTENVGKAKYRDVSEADLVATIEET